MCDVCADVVSTFRRSYPHLGARPLSVPLSAGGGGIDGGDMPAAPGCSAFAAGSALRAQCVTQRAALAGDAALDYHVWSAAKNAQPDYTTCIDLAHCDKDGGDCAASAGSAACLADPNCAGYRQHCAPACAACLWVVRSWPAFDSTCAPAAGTQPAGKVSFAQRDEAGGGLRADEEVGEAREADAAAEEAAAAAAAAEQRVVADADADADDADGDDLSGLVAEVARRGGSAGMVLAALRDGAGAASSLLELAADARVTAPPPPMLTQSAWRAKAQPALIPRGLGSPPLEVAVATRPPAADVHAECLAQWSALSAVPEAWQAVAGAEADGRLAGVTWDPVTACRCLSLCPYNSIDALAVEESCGGVFDERSPALAEGQQVAALAALAAAAAPPPAGASAAVERMRDTVFEATRAV